MPTGGLNRRLLGERRDGTNKNNPVDYFTSHDEGDSGSTNYEVLQFRLSKCLFLVSFRSLTQ